MTNEENFVDEENFVEKAAKETTAIISILTEPCRWDNINSPDKEVIIYSLHLSFVGATILPPFLPCMRGTGKRKRRKAIINKMKKISTMYIESYKDRKLTIEEGQQIRTAVEELGEDVANYLTHFTQILKTISMINVQNIIIHTDDYAIPWTWAYYSLDLENLQRDDPLMDFLCNRHPCGTLMVDTHPDALNRLKFWNKGRVKPTDKELLTQFKVSLLQGDLLKKKKIVEYERSAYLEKLETILESKFEEENIRSFTRSEWKDYSGDLEKFVDFFLDGNIKRAKIIHYLGHVEEGELLFDEATSISPSYLSSSLHAFQQHPLVVLHGCSSGLIVDSDKKDKQLPTVFLEKGASGCLTALLPVAIPVYGSSKAETMIDIFYRKVVLDMKSYGQALFEARREFRRQEETSHDPQWLFFQLYGDPREMLITTSGKGYLRRIEYFDQLLADEEDKVREAERLKATNKVKIDFAFDKNILPEDELVKALDEIEVSMAAAVNMGPALMILGDGGFLKELVSILGSPGMLKLVEITAEATVAVIIGKFIAKLENVFAKKGKNLKELNDTEIEKLKNRKGKVETIGFEFSSKSSEKGLRVFEIIDEQNDTQKKGEE